MCQKCEKNEYLSINPVEFRSMKSGKTKDLRFSAQEFVNACRSVQSGPFTDGTEDWLRVLRMYNRMITLRIDVLAFCAPFLSPLFIESKIFEQFRQATTTPRIAHHFGLPFSAQEFLAVIEEFDKYGNDKRGGILESQYAGSGRLFAAMVNDLDFHRINMKDFLDDNIPEQMEGSYMLLRLLSCVEGDNFEVNYRRFIQTTTRPSPGRIIGPMSHFQAAMFAQSLEEIDITKFPPGLAQKYSRPHGLCKNGVVPGDFVLIGSPCCSRCWPRCCLIQALVIVGPTCYCGSNMVEALKSLTHKS
ncbi:hypothetical protein BDU57DRAFT_161612 [Ampelomyces quisqualis]|uniref:Uncharacterized protein n=1 Tax=Ampelomyces quisqualis TaxID=50730 RepID=A0A6A5QRY5_AMPQU|nr:hypothetical protein BDU57DRAFT_161612 [Ampelomyces quisqualis]